MKQTIVQVPLATSVGENPAGLEPNGSDIYRENKSIKIYEKSQGVVIDHDDVLSECADTIIAERRETEPDFTIPKPIFGL